MGETTKFRFNPEQIWLDRIDHQFDADGQRVDLSGEHAVPADQLTEAICIKILQTRRSNWRNSLADVQDRLRTPAVCLAAITASTGEAKHVPMRSRWPERCPHHG